MNLNRNDLNNILLGASVLGCGGGGRYDLAEQIIKSIVKSIRLTSIKDIGNNDLIITVFGVGGLKQLGEVEKVNRKNIALLQKILKKEVKYIIPVEIGPMSIASVLNISAKLNLPVIDGDLVGYRAAPEIYLEAITLNNVNRLPLVASNSDGDTIILSAASSVENIETILRDFSARSKTKVYVAGYPMYKNMIQGYFGNNSLSYTAKLGQILKANSDEIKLKDELKVLDIEVIDEGKIINQIENDVAGFTVGKLKIKSNKEVYEVLYKNEFVVLIKNGKVLTTCPDSIFVIDLNVKRGINNGDNNKGKTVLIARKKAINIWRTKVGKKLFSPKTLGFTYKQKLIQ